MTHPWESDSPQRLLEVDCIDQFLWNHTSVPFYQGYLSLDFAGFLQGYQSIGGAVIDQPFTWQSFGSGGILLSGNVTSGSNIISNFLTNPGVQQGMNISGTGIPSGTTVIYVGSNYLQISANATATNTSVVLTFSAPGVTWVRVPVTNQALPAPLPPGNITGTITTSSAVISAITFSDSTFDLEDVWPGMPVTGTGIPAGTIVNSVDAVTAMTITMSNNATASAIETIYIGQPDPTEYQYAVDMTVGIYTDSAGAIGTQLASATISHEIIEAANNDSWPEPQDVLMGPGISHPPAAFPQALASTFPFFSAISCRSVTVGWPLFGSSTGLSEVPIWTNVYASGVLGGWIQGPGIPFPSGAGAGTQFDLRMAWCPNSNVVVAVLYCTNTSGGTPNYSVYTATLDQGGNLGAWQQVDPPSTQLEYQIVGCFTDSDLQDWACLVGGISGSANTQTFQYVDVDSSGSIGTWAYGSQFPIPTSSDNPAANQPQCFQLGSSMYVAAAPYGGFAESWDLYRLDNLLGAWTHQISLSGLQWAYYAEMFTNIGNNVLFWTQETPGSGTYLPFTVAMSPSGSASWQCSHSGNVLAAGATSSSSWTFSNPDGSSTIFWAQSAGGADPLPNIGSFQDAYPTRWITVPLSCTLTAGSTYHLVIAGANSDFLSNAQIPLITGNGAGTSVTDTINNTAVAAAKVTTDGTTWTQLPGTVKAMFFSGQFGPLMGFADDAGQRIDTFWYDNPSLTLTACTQQTISNWRATMTKGSDVLTLPEGFDINAGMYLVGPGIPANTYVKSTTDTTVTISANATMTGTFTISQDTQSNEAIVLGYTGGVLTSTTGLV
ncbi:MAG: hypothetical protein KGL39_44535 [Patescibacteria group bacterium]|nr:hypothetical protein [Patescibacteria group bacterium]